MSTPDVLIVGGGPAGLAAARALREAGVDDVVVLDREAEAGGIPRHSDHTGYGVRDLRTVLRGPEYARRLVEAARDSGARLRTAAMATGWAGERALDVTAPQGRERITAGAILLATGARERPRAARWIPGDRPDGVFTTGQLQQWVHLEHLPVGERAVIVGAELVSWSAVLTLRDAGCRTVLMTSEHAHPEVYGAVATAGRLLLDGPLARQTRVVRINGRTRVESVDIEHVVTGRRRSIACDTVVLTGDWIPDNELARTAALDFDTVSGSPIVDTVLRTSREGVFGAGNLLHPVDTADVAALDGRHAAAGIVRWLGGERAPGGAIRLRVQAPFRWVAPSLVRPGDPAPARGRLLLWADADRRLPVVTITQAGREVVRRRLAWPVAPGRAFRIPWSLCAGLDPSGGDAVIGLA